MALLPLTPGVRPVSDAGKAKAAQLKILVDKTLKRDDYTCRFCGFKSRKYQRTIPWAEDKDTGLVACCTFCEQCLSLERAGVTGAGILIWLPEIGQVELNHIARAIYIARAGRDKDEVAAGLANRALDTLAARRAEAKRRLGSDDPLALATVLQESLNAKERKDATARIDGIRLLPSEKHMVRTVRGDVNHLPAMIGYWTSPDGPFGDKPVERWDEMFKAAAAKAGHA